MKKGMIFVGSGFELVGMVLSALYIGSKLDAHFKTSGLWIAICLFLFMGVWTFHFVYLLRRFMLDLEKESDDENKQS